MHTVVNVFLSARLAKNKFFLEGELIMLTLRNQKIKAAFQVVLQNLERMEAFDNSFKEFRLSLAQNSIYSEKYKEKELEKAKAAYDTTIRACAESNSKEFNTICDLLEGNPEPVEINDETAQNMLNMIQLTKCKLPFEQLQYYVDQSRGNFVLLKMLAEVFKSYNLDYFAKQCAELSEELPIEQLQEMARVNGRLLYDTSNYNANDWYWCIVNIKRFLKQLDSNVVSEPNYKEQVAKLKETLAARNQEIESLRETDAAHIRIIDHYIEKG